MKVFKKKEIKTNGVHLFYRVFPAEINKWVAGHIPQILSNFNQMLLPMRKVHSQNFSTLAHNGLSNFCGNRSVSIFCNCSHFLVAFI